MFTSHHQGFLLLKLVTQAYARSSPVSTMMQVASMPLGLVSTKTSLISRSTHSEKLPFFQKAPTVDSCVLKIVRNEGGGVCTRQIEYLSKCSFPTFASKSCAKREAVFSGIYGKIIGMDNFTQGD